MRRLQLIVTTLVLTAAAGLVFAAATPAGDFADSPCSEVVGDNYTCPPARRGPSYALDIQLKEPWPDCTTMVVSSGSLPPGLSMGSAGDIRGTPTASGSYSVLRDGLVEHHTPVREPVTFRPQVHDQRQPAGPSCLRRDELVAGRQYRAGLHGAHADGGERERQLVEPRRRHTSPGSDPRRERGHLGHADGKRPAHLHRAGERLAEQRHEAALDLRRRSPRAAGRSTARSRRPRVSPPGAC